MPDGPYSCPRSDRRAPLLVGHRSYRHPEGAAVPASPIAQATRATQDAPPLRPRRPLRSRRPGGPRRRPGSRTETVGGYGPGRRAAAASAPSARDPAPKPRRKPWPARRKGLRKGRARGLRSRPGCTERTERPEADGHREPRGRISAHARVKVVRREIESFAQTHPSLFSQLHTGAEPLAKWPANPLATREERTDPTVRTLRGRAMHARPTSTLGSRVERFVIECFAPSCLVDITPDGELVTPAPRDTVDSIMSIEGWGPVQNRGESCRSERPDKNGETRTPRGA